MATKKPTTPKRAAPKKSRPRPAAEPSAAVVAFLAALEHPRRQEARELRDLILNIDPRIGEELKWNAPSFHLNQQHFATYHLRTPNLQLILHRGAKASGKKRPPIQDPGGLLEWLGEERACLKVTSAADLKERREAMQVILQNWIAAL